MLKQAGHQNRTLFLRLFTQELVINSKQKIVIEKEIEQKEKMQPIPPILEKEQIKEIPLAETKSFIPSILQPSQPPPQRTPMRHITKPTAKPLRFRPSPQISPLQLQPRIQPKTATPVSAAIGEANLGKLNVFLQDNAITEIECPGPGKSVIVKKAGQVNLTRITLSQAEINEVIENFSEKARIPVIKGIFKASIANLTIIAIISEFVGSRFIIYKASPYSLLEQQTQQLQQAQLQAQLRHSRNLSRSPQPLFQKFQKH